MAAQNMFGMMKMGFDPDPSQGTSSLDLAVATTLLGFSFKTNIDEQLSKVKVYCLGTTGVPLSGDLEIQFRADTSGSPATSSTESKSATGTPTAATIMEATGFTATSAITAGTQYWIVCKNINAVPATNHFTIQYVKNGSIDGGVGNNCQITGGHNGGFSIKFTNDGSGTNWSSGGNNPVPAYGIRLEFSSGRFLGLMLTAAAQDTTNTMFAARVGGIKFTTPASWPTTNVACVSLQVGKAGTVPASGLVYKLFTGASTTPGAATATSRTCAQANVTSNPGYLPIWFANNFTLVASTTYRLVAAVQNASDGSGGNDFRLYQFTVENDANSKAQLPFGGLAFTYSTDGTTFTDTDTKVIPFQLHLDSTTPFTASTSGASAARIQGGM